MSIGNVYVGEGVDEEGGVGLELEIDELITEVISTFMEEVLLLLQQLLRVKRIAPNAPLP